jgi:hypothetical protein
VLCRDEAIEAGRGLTERLGGRHIVDDADPTGGITDPVQD